MARVARATTNRPVQPIGPTIRPKPIVATMSRPIAIPIVATRLTIALTARP